MSTKSNLESRDELSQDDLAATASLGTREPDLVDDADLADADGDILELIRIRLELYDDVSDVTIAASVASIAAQTDQRGRWLAAFGSPLGRCLAARGVDFDIALNNLVALVSSRSQ